MIEGIMIQSEFSTWLMMMMIFLLILIIFIMRPPQAKTLLRKVKRTMSWTIRHTYHCASTHRKSPLDFSPTPTHPPYKYFGYVGVSASHLPVGHYRVSPRGTGVPPHSHLWWEWVFHKHPNNF
jgi:hypothetical protein